MNNATKLLKKLDMDRKKIQDWIINFQLMMSDAIIERYNTGEGVIYLPFDVYEILIKNGIIESVGSDKMGIFFDGIYGETYVTICAIRNKKERVKVVVNEERRNKILARYANKIQLSDIELFNEMPDDIRAQLNAIPYNTIVRCLCVQDFRNDMTVSGMAVKYGVPYTTIYQWFNK